MTGKNFCCIGAGTVGRAWTIVFARAGYSVNLFDQNPAVVREQALPAIEKSLLDLKDAGEIESVSNVLENIHSIDSLEQALVGVDYVQESVGENLKLKQQVFAELGALAGADTILASSTSAIPGSGFMQDVAHPERCLIVHPVNPPYLIPLVELCRTPLTSDAVLEQTKNLMIELGQRPIVLNKEIPGFILNRLQFTLFTEAMHLVGEGYCSPEDMDHAMKSGLGLRWAFMGPFETGHLNATDGFRGYINNLGEMIRGIAEDARMDYQWDDQLAARIDESMTKQIPREDVGKHQAQRDRRILALRRLLADLEKQPEGIE